MIDQVEKDHVFVCVCVCVCVCGCVVKSEEVVDIEADWLFCFVVRLWKPRTLHYT
jgi:hypothetical protein